MSVSVLAPNKDKRVIVVLGMHRSGTSAMTGCLEAAGVFLGDTNHYTFDNVKGNRESKRIMTMHNDMLSRVGASWLDPKTVEKWLPVHTVLRDLIIDTYDKAPVWGFKDPRTLFMLAGWLEALPTAEMVGIFRHPFFVAESLHKRNKFAHDAGLSLWMQYNRKLMEHYLKGNGFPVLEFSANDAEFNKQLSLLLAELKLSDDGASFFDSSLRQNELPKIEDSAIAQEALALYGELQAIRIDQPPIALAS